MTEESFFQRAERQLGVESMTAYRQECRRLSVSRLLEEVEEELDRLDPLCDCVEEAERLAVKLADLYCWPVAMDEAVEQVRLALQETDHLASLEGLRQILQEFQRLGVDPSQLCVLS